jgi:hypothetical protein
MHGSVTWPARRLAVVLLTLSIAIAACGGSSTASPTPGGDSSGAGASTDTSGAGGGGGGGAASAGAAGGGAGGGSDAGTVTGSLVSSGLYDATWTWQPGLAADIGVGGTSMQSDKGTFGSISVLADGSITFTSGASELKSGSYKGTGAQVHMQDAGGTPLPCGWTLDNDVTGTDGVIHLKGTMDVHGTIWGCP